MLGGDGTLLRAAETARPVGVPLLGVNLGPRRVPRRGRAGVAQRGAATRSSTARYAVEERMTVDAVALRQRRRDRPQLGAQRGRRSRSPAASGSSRWCSRSTAGRCRRSAATACCARRRPAPPPTRSPRAARSCGRRCEALLLVPSNAHALFARPMVISPDSQVAIEVAPTGPPAVLDCDGRRTFRAAAGRARGGHAGRRAGAHGAAGRATVHRPARAQVRPADARLARRAPRAAA